MADGPAILTLDIETSPHLCWSFGTRNVNIFNEQIVTPTRMMCFGAKWRDEDKVIFKSEYHDSKEAMVLEAYKLLDQCDVLVTYNGDKFDIPHLQREFHEMGLPPVSPFTSVDLYKVIKKRELWASHKLEWVTRQLELSGKLQHSGFYMWRACLGDYGEEEQRKQWNLMRRYCKRDVVTEDELFVEYLPYANLPHRDLWKNEKPDPDRPTCGTCGSERITWQGYKRTKTRRYRQFRCEECGKWDSVTRSDMGISSS